MPADTERVLVPVEEASLYPESLRTAEWGDRENEPLLGVALSGGGIRSATLSLGFFQGLARRGLVSSIDYLSTVSGGGYFGGFFGHLLQREASEARKGGPIPSNFADKVLRESDKPAFRYLRDNGRYLSPNGSGDVLAAASVALRNWMAVIVAIGLLALSLLSAATILRFAILTGLPTWVAGWNPPSPFRMMSPFLLASPVAVLVLAVPPAWAYWLVPDNPQSDGILVWIGKWLAPIGGAAAASWVLYKNGLLGSLSAIPTTTEPSTSQWLLVAAGVLSALTIGRYWVSLIRGFRDPQRQRRHLSRGLMRALVVIGVLIAIGVVDSIGQYIASWRDLRGAGLIGGLAAVGGMLRKQILGLATRVRANERPPLPTGLLVYAGAMILIIGMLGIIAAIPHLVVDVSAVNSSPLTPPRGWFRPLIWLFGVSVTLVIAVSRVWSFLNRSSLHALYEARLRRAYLGASNPERSGEGEERPAVTEPHVDDGMTWKDYDPSRCGGPIHLINVTINETVDGRSQVQQRDRKGTGMAVGPAGISVGTTHHALWLDRPQEGALARFRQAASDVLSDLRDGVRGAASASGRAIRKVTSRSVPGDERVAREPKPFRVFPSVAKPELLDVGQWIAISGGAVSTGLGARTNLALSLLLGFFNVRLGYWWMSGVDPKDRAGKIARTPLQDALALLRRRLPVQFALLDEWLARFPGVARREWYLTDGGHFENLGGYELLRRRLPFIVVCDNEQDRDYQFDGLANLVRKARTDLNAEITFLPERELARDKTLRPPDCVGSLESLRRGRRSVEPIPDPRENPRIVVDGNRTGLSLKHAALARIAYGGPVGSRKEGWLLYVKPSLDGDESIDVLRYHTEHPDFPQESTADQFFDEAQWESYRKLGEHLALQVFDSALAENSWHRSLILGHGSGIPDRLVSASGSAA